jgi:hypothetical protein
MQTKNLEPLVLPVNLNQLLFDTEVEFIKRALLATNNNVKEAAALLGLNRTTLVMRLTNYQIEAIRPKIVKTRALRLVPSPKEEKPKKTTPLALAFNPKNLEHTLW